MVACHDGAFGGVRGSSFIALFRKDGPDFQARWHVAPELTRPHIASYSPEAARSLAHQREAGRAGSPGRSAGEGRAKRRARRSGEAAGPSATDRSSSIYVLLPCEQNCTAAKATLREKYDSALCRREA
jgi:hypothetical protein